MIFRTEQTLSLAPNPVGYDDKLLLIGSCFSDNIGNWLTSRYFDVLVNPFGTLYNPLSTARCLRLLAADKRYAASELFEHDGLYHSFDHHSRFSAPTPDEALRRINDACIAGHRQLSRATRLVVTWGTAWVYRLADAEGGGSVVGNCHRLPEKRFVRSRLSVDEIATEWRSLIGELTAANPNLRLTLTVSPIRHLKDTLHGNQLSKATLLLAAEQLAAEMPDRVDYFPAYELLIDDLRDYRFYAADMVHPSETAVEYVRTKFAERYFTPATMAVLAQCEKIARALEHRPSDEKSESYKRFLTQNIQTIEQLTAKSTFFTLKTPLEEFERRLKNTET